MWDWGWTVPRSPLVQPHPKFGSDGCRAMPLIELRAAEAGRKMNFNCPRGFCMVLGWCLVCLFRGSVDCVCMRWGGRVFRASNPPVPNSLMAPGGPQAPHPAGFSFPLLPSQLLLLPRSCPAPLARSGLYWLLV